MSYRIAGIDVHKKMLAVVVSNVEVESEFRLSGECLAHTPTIALTGCVVARARGRGSGYGINGQYWKPVWGALERYWKARIRKKREGVKRRSGTLHLAQARCYAITGAARAKEGFRGYTERLVTND